MSYALDVGTLLYASDAESRLHARATEVLSEAAAGPELVYVAWITVMSYMRISTHPSIFERPLTPREAAANVESLIERPHVRLLSEGERFWKTYDEVTRGLVVRGNLVPDAHLAAILKEHGIRKLYTVDTDFRRFPFLEVHDPFG